MRALTLVAASGCVLVGGVFFAFSTLVMPALARLPAQQGVAAMRSVNVTAVRPPLMLALFGTAAACVALAVWSVVAGERVTWVVAGCVTYLAGVVGVTVARNVPLNDTLAAAEPPAAGELWGEYVAAWTRWNSVRTLAALGAAVLLLVPE